MMNPTTKEKLKYLIQNTGKILSRNDLAKGFGMNTVNRIMWPFEVMGVVEYIPYFGWHVDEKKFSKVYPELLKLNSFEDIVQFSKLSEKEK